MFCINCSYETTRVLNSRPSKKTPQIWRRRTCPACGHTFTTDELPRTTDIPVTPRGTGTDTTPFNPGKLLISIAGAFAHDPKKGTDSAWALTQTIIAKLFSNTHAQITAKDILITTHQTLEHFDQAAAAQYALSHQLITSLKRRGRPSFGAAPAAPAPERQA